MKALTVQQPWAWAIVEGVKDVENRTTLWKHRGPLAIHAGKRWSERGARSPLVGGLYLDRIAEHGWAASAGREAWLKRQAEVGLAEGILEPDQFGAIVGTVNVVDAHREYVGCCSTSPWAESSYVEAGGAVRKQIVHMVLEDAVRFEDPIPALGMNGLWTLNDVQALEVSAA